jgi:cystathionine beta-lyase
VTEQNNGNDNPETPGYRPDTVLNHAGRHPHDYHGFVNTPLVRASTVLFPDVDALQKRMGKRYPYGLTNTPTIEALTEAVDALENSAGTVLVPSGLAAITVPILAFATPGTRILVPDNVYWPTRRFCNETLIRQGVETRYYDPIIGGEIARLFGPDNTILLFEAPGSNTFETPDITAMVAAAKSAGVVTMMDNTWSTPLFFRPIDHGIDISLQAGTKYLAGHSDLLIGTVSANETAWPVLKQYHRNIGTQAGTEEIWLTLRGMRTLGVRLDRHEKSGLEIANWLAGRSEVRQVLHPALPSCPGHEHWAALIGRSNGLFAFELDAQEDQALAFLDALRIFGLGYSWGGFESLAVPAELKLTRTTCKWTGGPVIRLHVGLEDVGDLIGDLERGFAALHAHAG